MYMDGWQTLCLHVIDWKQYHKEIYSDDDENDVFHMVWWKTILLQCLADCESNQIMYHQITFQTSRYSFFISTALPSVILNFVIRADIYVIVKNLIVSAALGKSGGLGANYSLQPSIFLFCLTSCMSSTKRLMCWSVSWGRKWTRATLTFPPTSLVVLWTSYVVSIIWLILPF